MTYRIEYTFRINCMRIGNVPSATVPPNYTISTSSTNQPSIYYLRSERKHTLKSSGRLSPSLLGPALANSVAGAAVDW